MRTFHFGNVAQKGGVEIGRHLASGFARPVLHKDTRTIVDILICQRRQLFSRRIQAIADGKDHRRVPPAREQLHHEQSDAGREKHIKEERTLKALAKAKTFGG